MSSVTQGLETASTVYGTGNHRVVIEHDELGEPYTVRLTNHAIEKYDERTPDWSDAPEFALRNAIPCIHLNGEAYRRTDNTPYADMGHYFAGWNDDHTAWYDIIFLETNTTIRTVYTVRKLPAPEIRAYFNVLRARLLGENP